MEWATLDWGFASAGMAGTGVGTVMLTWLHSDLLLLGVALVVFAYVAFRLARPGWALPRAPGERLAVPCGAAAGLLTGTSGISAPISIT